MKGRVADQGERRNAGPSPQAAAGEGISVTSAGSADISRW